MIPADAQAKYRKQARLAHLRHIPFLLTLEEWWAWWQQDGRWERRGRKKGQLVMSRRRDAGPYELGNIAAIEVGQNHKEGWETRPQSKRNVGRGKGRPVHTPIGSFKNCGDAGRAFGIKNSTACHWAQYGRHGWSYISPLDTPTPSV